MTKLDYKSASDKDDLQSNYGRRRQILKLEYLSSHWSDIPQILNLNIQSNYRRRPQISKLEYLSNHWSDPHQILNSSLYDQIKQ